MADSVLQKKKPVLWPLVSIPVGCALGIILKNPALGVAVAMFGGAVFMPFNLRMETRRAKTTAGAFIFLTLLSVGLAATGRPALVWVLLFAACLVQVYPDRRYWSAGKR